MLTNLTLLFDRSLYWILTASFILLKKSKIPFLSELYLDTVTHYWKINTWKFPGGQKVKNNYSNMRVGTIDCSFYIMLSAYSLQVEQLFSEPMCIWTFFQLFIHLFITFFCCCVFLVNTLLGMNALYQPTQICIFFKNQNYFIKVLNKDSDPVVDLLTFIVVHASQFNILTLWSLILLILIISILYWKILLLAQLVVVRLSL